MKHRSKAALWAAMAGCWLPAVAQDDTVRTVYLQDIQVTGAQQSANDRLLHFFKANANTTLEDVLSRMPEVSLVRRGSYGMEPTLRTMSGGQINLMIDGIRVHGACTDRMDPATIYMEPVNLDRIAVQTGPAGAAMGATLGGSIDLRMAAPRLGGPQAWRGTISQGYQSAAKAWLTTGALAYSGQKWAVRGSGTFRSSNNYRDGKGQEVAFSQYHKTNFSLSASFALDEDTRLQADVLTDDGWEIGYPALPMDVGSASLRLGALSWHRQRPGSRWQRSELKLYANQVIHRMDDTDRPLVPMHMDMPGISRTIGAYAETEARMGVGHRLTLRADLSSTYLKASMTMYPKDEPPMYMLTWPDNRRLQTGLSAQWLWAADSLSTLGATLRLDAIQSAPASEEAKDYIAITGGLTGKRYDVPVNAGLQYSRMLRRHLRLGVKAGLAQRVPTATELYGFYLFNAFDRYDYLGVTDLKLESAGQTELSLQGRVGKAFHLQGTVFYHRIFNYIAGVVQPGYRPMTIGALGVKMFEQNGGAQLLGAEGSVQWKPEGCFSGTATLRYTYGRLDGGSPMPMIPPLKQVTAMRYVHGAFSAQLEYEAAMGQQRVLEVAGEQTTPAYLLLHARTGYAWAFGVSRLTLQAGVENLLDAAYRDHLDWGSVLRPGRNLYLQVALSF